VSSSGPVTLSRSILRMSASRPSMRLATVTGLFRASLARAATLARRAVSLASFSASRALPSVCHALSMARRCPRSEWCPTFTGSPIGGTRSVASLSFCHAVSAAARLRSALSASAAARSSARSAFAASRSAALRTVSSMSVPTLWPSASRAVAVRSILLPSGRWSRVRGTYHAPRLRDQRHPFAFNTSPVPSPRLVP
jgi:hypothetical protein